MEWLLAWVRDDSKVPTSRPGRSPRPRSGEPSANGTGQHRPDHLAAAPRRRVLPYLAKCEKAVSGDTGHKKLFWAARVVVRGFLVPCTDDGYGDAFDLLKAEYNPRCEPPWSDEEIRHKVQEALEVDFDLPWGWLLRPETFSNFREEEVRDDDKVKMVKVGLPADAIAAKLNDIAPGWPKRVKDQLFVPDGGNEPRPLWLGEATALLAWVGRQLPTGQETNPVQWSGNGTTMMPAAQFHAFLRQTVEDFDAVELYPHHPQLPRHHYMLRPMPTGGNGRRLAEFVAKFSPATPEDRDLIRALVLTLVWGGRPGARPAFLISTDPEALDGGRGCGKTTFAELMARLMGGHVSLEAEMDRKELVTRLLSPVGMERRVLVLDNLKSLKFSNADLESLITTTAISGRQLYVGEASRPNTLVTLLTVNGAALSKDLAQRCVPIYLKRPTYAPGWREQVEQFIDEHRWEILADAVAILQAAPLEPLTKHSRWGAWEAEVLSRVSNPEECQNLIVERQDGVDEDAAEADLVREHFITRLRDRGHSPATCVVKIPSQTAALWTNEATGERRATNKASAYLRTLKIPELRKADGEKARGWVWIGKESPAGAQPEELRELQEEPTPWRMTASGRY